MVLDDKAKKNISALLRDYHRKYADLNFFYSLIDIINEIPFFDGCLKACICDGQPSFCADYLSHEVFVNPDYAYLEVYDLMLAYLDGLSKEKKYYLYNLIFTSRIIHECGHVEQSLIGLDKKSEYEYLSYIYEQIINAFQKIGRRGQYLYNRDGSNYSFERHANVVSFREIIDLIRDEELNTIMKEFYLASIGFGYYEKRKKLISPVEFTFKRLHIKEKLEVPDMPMEVKLNHGLPVDKMVYDNFFGLFENKALEEINYEEVVKRLKGRS